MKLRHIEVFHAVYVTGSVSGGARALNVSQPSVSKTLKYAEDQLGFALFHRISGRLIPSEKGKKLFVEVEPIFDQLNELTRFTTNLKNTKTGYLRFAMTPAFGLEVGPMALTQFSKKNPEITIETETLHAHQVVKALLDNTIDMGLVFDAPRFPGVQKLKIGRSGFVCVAPEGMELPNSGELKITDLQNFPLITLNQKSALGKILTHRLEDEFDGPVNGKIIVETYHLAKRLVKQNAGIAIIDAITALSGDVRGLQIRNIVPEIPISLDVIVRLNDSETRFQSLFYNDLKSAINAFRSKKQYINLLK